MPASSRTNRSLIGLALLAAAAGVAMTGAAGQLHGAPTRAHPALAGFGTGAVRTIVSESRGSAADIAIQTQADLRRAHLAPRAPVRSSAEWITRANTDPPAPSPRSEPRVAASADASASAALSGRNRVSMPALGIRGSVASFACSSTAYPGDRIYRWGCAGRNNVYLFGHAHSVFKPLHDAYVRGSLRKGMTVLYADGGGRVHAYKVAWWKVTTPDKGAFAYAAQSRPSMTLQTCVGSRSQYRLIVRLTRSS
jgi:hypothetical protein